MRVLSLLPLLAMPLVVGCGSLSMLPLSGVTALLSATHPETLRKSGRSVSQLERKAEYRLERFHWAEYSGNEPGGGTLLDETGATHSFGYSVLFTDLDLRLSAELLIGDVDYDGQTMTGIPFSTETDYRALEFDAVWQREMRFRYWDEFYFLVGGTTRSWSRDINSTPAVMGYVEDWFVCPGSDVRHLRCARDRRWRRFLPRGPRVSATPGRRRDRRLRCRHRS